MKLLDDDLKQLPAPLQRAIGHAGSLVLGLVFAVLLSYVLYRIGLPSKPFIYVAF
jgi:hypothetical protein